MIHTFTLIDDHRDEALVEGVLEGTVPAKAILTASDKEAAYTLLNRGASGSLPFLGTSTKIDAGRGIGVLTKVLYMMPARSSGTNACPFASKGCEAACLAEQTGRMSMKGSQRARRRRHASFMLDRERFVADLAREIAAHEKQAAKLGKTCAVRLNGTTDILWERIETTIDGVSATLMDHFPGVWFYDYTKVPAKARRADRLPANYHLTYSLSEREGAEDHAAEYLNLGYSVAVVLNVKKGEAPLLWTLPGHGPRVVVDGDKTDVRFLDPAGVIVALSAKGRAKTDTSGFVRAAA